MPRVRYDGPFRVSEIPTVAERMRETPAVADYPTAPAPKAMALHPSGTAYAVTGAPTQRAAEEQALAQCDAEHARRTPPIPCLLYASGNQVVLAKRRTVPITPTVPARARSITEGASQ